MSDIKHTGHDWQKISESEVTTKERGKVIRKVNQAMWICDNCSAATLIDTPAGEESRHPNSMKVLYGMEPQEIDGVTILEPEIGPCNAEYVAQVMEA